MLWGKKTAASVLDCRVWRVKDVAVILISRLLAWVSLVAAAESRLPDLFERWEWTEDGKNNPTTTCNQQNLKAYEMLGSLVTNLQRFWVVQQTNLRGLREVQPENYRTPSEDWRTDWLTEIRAERVCEVSARSRHLKTFSCEMRVTLKALTAQNEAHVWAGGGPNRFLVIGTQNRLPLPCSCRNGAGFAALASQCGRSQRRRSIDRLSSNLPSLLRYICSFWNRGVVYSSGRAGEGVCVGGLLCSEAFQ